MNKKLLLFPLIGCALLASCTEEGTNDTNNAVGLPQKAQGKTVTFKAAPLSIETKSTSTKVDVKAEGNNDVLKWTNEDVSFFFYAGAGKQFYSDFTVTKGWLEDEIDMDGDMPQLAGGYGIYAMSPAGDYFKDGSSTSILTIPQVQSQNGTNLSHLSPYIFLYSHPSTNLVVDNSGNSAGEILLNFDILASLVRFDVVNKSTKLITLNSIKIKLNNGGSLYTMATLQENSGALTGYSGQVTDMTLNLSNSNVSGGSSFAAYMASWPSVSSGSFEITLNVSFTGSDGVDFVYDLSGVNFVAGERTAIELNIVEDDTVPPMPYTSKKETIGGLEYVTLTYQPPGGSTITWMVTNYNYNSVDNGYDLYTRNCPQGWRPPVADDLQNLAELLNSNKGAYDLFIENQYGRGDIYLQYHDGVLQTNYPSVQTYRVTSGSYAKNSFSASYASYAIEGRSHSLVLRGFREVSYYPTFRPYEYSINDVPGWSNYGYTYERKSLSPVRCVK